ncbi:MAG TPA: hypothetical protein VF070_25485 [Streptosporangiaceae bacterium]
MPGLLLQRYGPGKALEMLESLTEVYTEAYAGPPYDERPEVYGREAFIERTTRQASRNGFTLVTGDIGESLAGYTFGLRNEPGTWLPGESDPSPPAELVQASRFFVVELIIRKPFRGHGYSHQLMNSLLADRTESFAALTARPGGFPQAMYLRWGWTTVCKLTLANAPVIFDVMVLKLPALSAHEPPPCSTPCSVC